MKTDYRKKRGWVFQDYNSSPLYNLLSHEDFRSLTRGMCDGLNKELSLLEELNQIIYSSNVVCDIITSADKKLLMAAIKKHASLLLEDIRVLLQYGIGYAQLSFPFNDLSEQLQKLCFITPSIIQYIEKNKKTITGNKSGQTINKLISQLIVLYEKITNKKAKENFFLPKAHSLPYTGELYNFISKVFKIIERKLGNNNPYKINLHPTSLALGKRIEKNLKKPTMVKLFEAPLFL